MSYLCRLRSSSPFFPFSVYATVWPFSLIIISLLFRFFHTEIIGESNQVAGQCWNGRAYDERRAHHASQREVLRRNGEVWLMARNVFGWRCLQLKGIEIGTTKGSTSEQKRLFTFLKPLTSLSFVRLNPLFQLIYWSSCFINAPHRVTD